ncbi:unnamed protein product, partial [Didymodactylos carnosus]
AVRVKYRLSALKYDRCYSKLIRPRMSDFLNDERKRQLQTMKHQLAQAAAARVNERNENEHY